MDRDLVLIGDPLAVVDLLDSEALALNETDIDERRDRGRCVTVKRRAPASWDGRVGFEQLGAWPAQLAVAARTMPRVIDGPTATLIGGHRGAGRAPPARRGGGVRRRSRRINCATPTRSDSRARASRSTSSSSRSDTPTSAPPRHTSRASTRARSSTRSAFADHPPCRPPPDSRSGNNTRQRHQGAASPTGRAGRALGLAWAGAAARLDEPDG